MYIFTCVHCSYVIKCGQIYAYERTYHKNMKMSKQVDMASGPGFPVQSKEQKSQLSSPFSPLWH